ncbi:MAG: helix-turn-helix domain-containing protein [Lachnospiraceae bacterium]|nr:helix-turn-helix domain-containing protein [Lachnospiraceae bacterium]
MIDEKIFEQMDRTLHEYIFRQREESFEHATYSEELSTAQPVKDGDEKAVERVIRQHRTLPLPELSDSPVQSRKYLIVCDITVICRFCMEGGMPPEESYGLSDLYIRKVDQCRTWEEVEETYGTMMRDYTRRMKEYRTKRRDLSPKTLLAVNYIQNHLHDRITVADLAGELEMNASYLSTLFAKEMGLSVSAFIRAQKLAAAKHLLSYTEYSSTEIAEYLGFSGESHFSAQFTKQEGVSPKEFRRREYQKHFEVNISGITQRDLQKKR